MSAGVNRVVQGEADPVICPICLAAVGANIVTTACAHVFDRDCLQGWVNAQPDASCPTCRRPLDVVVLHIVPNGAQEVEGQVADAAEDRELVRRRRCIICAAIVVFLGLGGILGGNAYIDSQARH